MVMIGIDRHKSTHTAVAVSITDAVVSHRMLIAQELVAEIAEMDDRLKASNKRRAEAVRASGSTVTDVVGIGPFCAATIIGYTGNIGRFPAKNHNATDNATAPIEASSGDNARHRLNPRGNRYINHAIDIAAASQLSYDSEGPSLLRPQTRRRQEPEGSSAMSQAQNLRRCVPTPCR